MYRSYTAYPAPLNQMLSFGAVSFQTIRWLKAFQKNVVFIELFLLNKLNFLLMSF